MPMLSKIGRQLVRFDVSHNTSELLVELLSFDLFANLLHDCQLFVHVVVRVAHLIKVSELFRNPVEHFHRLCRLEEDNADVEGDEEVADPG